MTDGARRPTRFIVLTSGRSGSSWLMEMLNSHPTVGGYGELFSTRFTTRFPQTRAATYGDPGGIPFFGAYLQDRRGINPLAVPYAGTRYLNGVFAPRAGLEAIGFRVRYGHLRVRWGGLPVGAWFFPYLSARRVRVVYLRRNSLDFLVSRAAAVASGLRHARAEDEVERPRISLDTETLLPDLERREAHDRRIGRVLSLLRLPTLEITYEDLLADTIATYQHVLSFLGAEPSNHEPRWGMRKMIDAPRSEVIENYESVKQALEGTKYAGLLD